MKIINCNQRSDEWFKARYGMPTGSSFDKIITSKGDPSKSQKKYMYKLAGEYISQSCEETYQSAAMARGTEMEEEARNLYEFVTGMEVQEVGFCVVKDEETQTKYGCSPDGLIGEDGCIEIKCPLMVTHVEYLLGNKLPTSYVQQVQGHLLVTGRKWCDFVSYYPGLKPLIIRVERDPNLIACLTVELESFCKGLQEIIERIK